MAFLKKNESCPEVDGATDMPEVYKIHMVSMILAEESDELANVRLYSWIM